jgi:hypothetical protein
MPRKRKATAEVEKALVPARHAFLIASRSDTVAPRKKGSAPGAVFEVVNKTTVSAVPRNAQQRAAAREALLSVAQAVGELKAATAQAHVRSILSLALARIVPDGNAKRFLAVGPDDPAIASFMAQLSAVGDAAEAEAKAIKPGRGDSADLSANALMQKLLAMWREHRGEFPKPSGEFLEFCREAGAQMGVDLTTDRVRHFLKKERKGDALARAWSSLVRPRE